jgi:hypothetical protein
MLVLISDPGVLAQSSCCLRRSTSLGQFSAALAGEVNKALVKGVHCPGP